MPTYEYECQSCGHRFEKIQAFSEEPITKCPECECEVKRVISAPAFQFKGGKPSAERRMHRGKPIHQAKDGHWEENGIIDRR